MSHPPTKERLDYLTQLLKTDNVPIPPENIGEGKTQASIGAVTSVKDNNITFISSVNLNPGDVVWLLKKGWDKYYENRALNPYARAIVQKSGKEYQAKYTMLTNMNKSLVKQGSLVYISNSLAVSTASLVSDVDFSIKNGKPYFYNPTSINKYNRYFAYHVVWNSETDTSDIEAFSYITILDNTKPTGYLNVSRSNYQYIPFDSYTIIKTIEDKYEESWIGNVTSVDVSAKRISIHIRKELNTNKKYAVVMPDWNKNENLESRIICRLNMDDYTKSNLIKLSDFTQGFIIDDIKIGCDIYEVN